MPEPQFHECVGPPAKEVARVSCHVIALVVLIVAVAAGCVGDGGSVPRSGRPQEPVGSLPYRSQEVRFENARAGIELAGTLTLPPEKGLHPAIVLVTGAGPQDRDETVAGHKPFLVLADYLTRRGLAVLRFDDRGVGESTGNFENTAIRDHASDTLAAVQYLRSRNKIDPERIGLLGHSQGGLTVPIAALDIPGQVAFLVLLATPGMNGEEIFYLEDAAEARIRGVDEATIERSRQRKQKIFGVLKQEADLEKAAVKLGQTMMAMEMTERERTEIEAAGLEIQDLIDQQIRVLNTKDIRFFLKYEPSTTLKQLDIPVLALTGERDVQVPPDENLPLIEAALAEGRCPDYIVRELPGLNHLFQTSETGSPDEYPQIEETFAPVALEMIADWVLEVLHDSGSEPSR